MSVFMLSGNPNYWYYSLPLRNYPNPKLPFLMEKSSNLVGCLHRRNG